MFSTSLRAQLSGDLTYQQDETTVLLFGPDVADGAQQSQHPPDPYADVAKGHQMDGEGAHDLDEGGRAIHDPHAHTQQHQPTQLREEEGA